MRRGVITVGAIVVALAAGSASFEVSAAPGDITRPDTDADSGTLIPTAQVQSFAPGTGGGGSGPQCRWERLEDGTGSGTGSSLPGTRDGAGGTEVLYFRTCPAPGPSGYVYVPPVDVADLRENARRSVERQLPAPALEVSPPAGAGGLIRMQNWLAVAPADDVTATAALGPVWITMTATQDSLVWDMGNGDTVDCDDIGTPAPDGADLLDDRVNGEAPCGYTYENVSAPQFGANDDLAYENTVTTNWAISWVDYTGTTGTEDDIPRETPWEFQVRQIQTVRTSGSGSSSSSPGCPPEGCEAP